MNRRRLMLAIGAALLVGGWGAMRYWELHLVAPTPVLYVAGIVSMAVGAGSIGFAALRPTNSKDE